MPAASSQPRQLSSADVAVSVNVGRKLARGEIDATTALHWLRGWVQQSTTSPSWRVVRPEAE